jgi:peptidoglycan/LPS O-acetylase OafA/YrhL
MQKRIYGLDILRAIAIIDILIGHSFYLVNQNFFGMFDGVNLFFVLSGFLIGKILIKNMEREFTIKSLYTFWYRRWMRTLPAYFFILIILIAHSMAVHHSPFVHYSEYLFFVQCIKEASWKSIFPESWSLCIEEWFYFLIPIFFFLLRKFSMLSIKQIVLTVSIAVIILETFIRIFLVHKGSNFDSWNTDIRQSTFMRLDSIMYGVVGACFSYYKMWRREKLLFVIGLIIWAITIITSHIGYDTFWYFSLLSTQCIGTLLLLPLLNKLKTGRGIFFRFITFTSAISYSMYLLNLTPYSLITKSIPGSYFKVFGCMIFSYIGAYIMYKLIERPFMNLRDAKINRYRGLNRINEKEDFIPLRLKATEKE